MLLRRITKHVTDQNWFAVFIDFLIVVLGVFIGIQVANWNEQRGDQEEYKLALERLQDEMRANLEVLEIVEAGSELRIAEVENAIDALRSCEHSAENVQLIEQGIRRILGTATLHIKMAALDELTSAPELLAQQSPSVRNLLSTAKFNLDVLKTEADFSESLPFRDRPETNPLIALGQPVERNGEYHGLTYSRTVYALEWAGRVDESCKDDQLLKSLYNWHRHQGAIPAYAVAMRSELNKLFEITGQATKGNAP